MLGRNVQRKLGTTGRLPRRVLSPHSEGGAYNPQGGEVVPCRPAGHMGPIKCLMDRDNITRTVARAPGVERLSRSHGGGIKRLRNLDAERG